MSPRLASDSSSRRASLRTARLITGQVMASGRAFSTSRIQREVSQVHGHTGSNQKSTGIRRWAFFMPRVQTESRSPLTRAGRRSVLGERAGEGRQVDQSGAVALGLLLLPLFRSGPAR